MKQFFNELCDYEFTGEVKVDEYEDEEDIPIMVKAEDQNRLDEKAKQKMGDVSKPLVSYEIRGKKEKETTVVKSNWIHKKILISDLSNFNKCHKIW